MTGWDRRALHVLAALLAVVVGALWWLLPGAEPRTGLLTIALFASASAIAELHPIRHRLGDPVPATLAVVGAAAIMGMSPVTVAIIAGLGWGLARAVERRGGGFRVLFARAAAGWSLSGVAALGAWLAPQRFTGPVGAGLPAAELPVGAATAVSLAIVFGIPAVWAVGRLRGRWRFVARRVAEAIHSTWMISLAITSTAVLGALVHPVLGHWTLPTMLLPLLAARIGLDRYAVASRAYDQTIRAMSRLPEQLGSVAADHGVRVADLAHEVGLELGLDAGTLSDIEHAAHLHELGRVAIERDTGRVEGRRALAEAGATVLAEATDTLDRVARIIAASGTPALAHPHDVRVPARIVAACCEADRYDADLRRAGQRDELVVRLVREVADLEVVGALARVLDRRVFAA